MKAFYKKSLTSTRHFLSKFYLGKKTAQLSYRAIAATAIVIWLVSSIAGFIVLPGTWFGVVPVILVLAVGFLVSAGSVLIFMLIKRLPKSFFWFIPGAFFLLSFTFMNSDLSWQFPLLAILSAAFAGSGLTLLMPKERGSLSLSQRLMKGFCLLLGTSSLIWGLLWVLDKGEVPENPPVNAALHTDYRPDLLDLPHPGEMGDFAFDSFTYGSGNDEHREEFGAGVQLTTESVDGSAFIDNTDNLAGKLRKWFWGHDMTELPLNGRVWFPKGNGPFPLALIVHGNHSMYDYSDPGYEYLGELLASQGIILVSVDQNFINSGWPDFFGSGLKEENDARGWLLLEHLKQWQYWNEDSENPFHEKIDFDNLAVMGHSRGGEAAAIAAFFNKLPFYPDNAKETFDYHFNIKAVVAIAPVDGQYKPGKTGTPLKDVNYLVLHGANDGDVQSFQGLRQYNRLSFSDSSDFFKSSIYIYGANHGQFNTTWGNKDNMYPMATLLNTKALLPFEEQLQIGKTFISAFLQSTLLGKDEYKRFFKDYRQGMEWLPETIYLQQFQDASWQTLINYEEDLDLSTTLTGGKIETEHLTVWREQVVNMKYGNQETRAVYIGWDSLAHDQEQASYQIRFEKAIDMQAKPILTFDLAESKENSFPDKDKEEERAEENDNNLQDNESLTQNSNSDQKESSKEKEKPKAPIDFTLQLTDSAGQTIKIPLSSFSYLQRQLAVDVLKNPGLQNLKTSESVFQTFFIDFSKEHLVNKSFFADEVVQMTFVFDQSKKGVIILDQLAIH